MVEIDRILEGIARTLENSVLPVLDGGFARGQLFAVLEVLTSLQGQVQWGGMLLENEAAALSSLIAQAAAATDGELAQRLGAYAASADAPLGERLREGRSLVCALIDAGLADEGELAVAVDAHLTNDTIFKAMALRPSRLAEISQG